MRRRCRFLSRVLVVVACGALAAAASAQETGPAPEPAPAPAPGQELDLDRLLKPRAPAPVTGEQTFGGRDRAGWQEQFKRARAEVADLEGKVDFTQGRLREAAAGDWNYSPAGGEAADPEILKLRAQLRRDRQSLESARQRLRDLQVEASLAGVPEEWRAP
jgi:hypothetical protein